MNILHGDIEAFAARRNGRWNRLAELLDLVDEEGPAALGRDGAQELVRLYRSGDEEGARRLNDRLMLVNAALGVATNPIAVKAALNLLGHEVGGLRLPLVEATDDEVALIRAGLEESNVLRR